MKTETILKYSENGREYKVIKFYGTEKPYRIYNIYCDYSKDGFLKEHRKEMARYADIASCFCWFVQNYIRKEGRA